MTLWDSVLRQVKDEMPPVDWSRRRSWPGFVGALVVATIVLCIWFPIRLLYEILKAVDLSDKSDHKQSALELFRQAHELSLALPSKSEFARSVLERFSLPTPLHDVWHRILRQLYAENMPLEIAPIPNDLDGLDGIRWRDRTRADIRRMRNDALSHMREAASLSVAASQSDLPNMVGQGEVTAALKTLVLAGPYVERLIGPLIAEVFPRFRDQYEANQYKLSGVTRGGDIKPGKLATPHQFDDPSSFFADTPFKGFLDTAIPIEIPNSIRTEHCWIVSGSGGGKTNALHYLIAKDLERAARGECSIVVLDSQRQLMEDLMALKIFAPGQALDGKLCLLDAADVEFPLAINLFDMKLDRMASFSPLQREKVMNSALEMYDFIIGSLLQAEMTSRQTTLFHFVTRAMFAIPGATIKTFHDLLKNGARKYQASIDTLDETTQQFFATDFDGPQFKKTKEEVTARLWSVMGNPTFLSMFSNPVSKLDLFFEINAPGKVILINAEKGLLQDSGTELFGRFFLALINQAAAQRSTIPKERRLPCYVYVDECHNYIRSDPKIQVILAEARQQNVGLILSHQYLAQIDPPVLKALEGNTSIKMASRLEGTDSMAMARDMGTVPEFIRKQPVGSFAAFVRGKTPSAISMKFPYQALSRFEVMTAREKSIVVARNRERYANPSHPSKTDNTSSKDSSGSARNRDPDED